MSTPTTALQALIKAHDDWIASIAPGFREAIDDPLSDAVEDARAALSAPAQDAQAEPSQSMRDTAKRNLHAYLTKASFASSVDRAAALECLNVLSSGVPNVQLAGDSDAPASGQQRQVAGPLEVGQHVDRGHESQSGYSGPQGHVDLAAPVAQDALTGEREAAEQAYIRLVFDIASGPIGSRDWTLFYKGWQAARTQPAPAPQDAQVGDVAASTQGHDGTSFLCRIWGEDIDHTLTAIVPDWDGVRRFCVENYTGSENHADYDGKLTLETLKENFDEHEAKGSAGAYVENWEIGGLSIERICDCTPARTQPATPAPVDAADTFTRLVSACQIAASTVHEHAPSDTRDQFERALSDAERALLADHFVGVNKMVPVDAAATVPDKQDSMARQYLRERVAAQMATMYEAAERVQHELKTDPEVFAAVLEGRKTFEIRRDDRGFKVGDSLHLRETTSTGQQMRNGAPLQYTGREVTRTVSHVLSGYGLMDGWVCLSLAATPPAAPQASGIAAAAAWVRKRRDEFIAIHADTDPDTGELEYGRGASAEAKREYVGELEEIIEGIEALTGCDVPPPGWQCTRAKGHEGPCAAAPTAPQAVPLTDAQAPAGQGRLPCGHEQALLIRSAQTGEPLYCEACDDKSGRADAEAMEQELREKLDAATLKPQAPALVPLTGHHKLDNDKQVFFYEQDFYVLSNFSSFNLEWNGLTFPTSEHAYHWEKFASELLGAPGGRSDIAHLILTAPSAHEAFKIAERMKAQRRADWDAVKVNIMRDILRAKADQHEYVRRKLLATGDRELIEDSWRDDYWGWGPNRDGQNMLGKLWMEVRAELRAGISTTATKEQSK